MVEAKEETEGAGGGEKSRLWPMIITVGLVIVMVVNFLFIYIAVKGADAVVPSYNSEQR
jgi:flagellar basal body-associated protein FliL